MSFRVGGQVSTNKYIFTKRMKQIKSGITKQALKWQLGVTLSFVRLKLTGTEDGFLAEPSTPRIFPSSIAITCTNPMPLVHR